MILTSFLSASQGSTAVVFGASAPVALGVTGLALDYSKWNGSRSKLQQIADQAALAAARELKLAGATPTLAKASVMMAAAAAMTDQPTQIADLAKRFASAAVANDPNIPVINVTVPSDLSSITVEMTQTVPTILAQPLGLPFATVTAKAKAKVTSSVPLCVLLLDPAAPKELSVTGTSTVNASGCAVKANSTDPKAISVLDSAVLTSRAACVAGGYEGVSTNYSVPPQTGCPAYPDPLAAKVQPVVPSTCDHNIMILGVGTHTISPGTYCGGLTLTLGAVVTAQPGVYIIKDGPLTVTLGAKLTGNGAGFFLTGPLTALAFDGTSQVDLSAPIDGPMAGMLFWEDRNASPKMPHILAAKSARNLLGTIYMPKGTLTIDSANPVADASFFTIIVANKLVVKKGNVVLNSNYASSVVPVPTGLGTAMTGSVALEY